MNVNYEFSSMMLPLKTMCTVKMAQQFVVANRIHLIENEFEEKEAIKRVRNLKLPRIVIESVENIIEPIALELFEWNKLSEGYGDPVWTSLGTVDLVQSAKLIVQNENVDKMFRYKLACHCCFEKCISELFTEFMKDPNFDSYLNVMEGGDPLVRYWTHSLTFKFGISDQPTRRSSIVRGFVAADYARNDIAMKYFISKPHPVRFITRVRYLAPCHLVTSPLLPAAFSLIFAYMSSDNIEKYMSTFSGNLLIALLKWPYQGFFLEALHSVATHLDKLSYCAIISHLINFITYDNRDYDYGELFTSLWPMRRYYYYWKGTGNLRKKFCWTVFRVILTKDEELINFLFNSMSEAEKDALLKEFIIGNFKMGSLYATKFNQNMLLDSGSYKNKSRYPPLHVSPNPQLVNSVKDIVNEGLQQFAKIVNVKIAAERMPSEFDPEIVFAFT